MYPVKSIYTAFIVFPCTCKGLCNCSYINHAVCSVQLFRFGICWKSPNKHAMKQYSYEQYCNLFWAQFVPKPFGIHMLFSTFQESYKSVTLRAFYPQIKHCFLRWDLTQLNHFKTSSFSLRFISIYWRLTGFQQNHITCW